MLLLELEFLGLYEYRCIDHYCENNIIYNSYLSSIMSVGIGFTFCRKYRNKTECLIEKNSEQIEDPIHKIKYFLEKLYISGNRMVRGLSNILYNLAFQPSIRIIDISSNTTCDKNETSCCSIDI